MPGFGNFLSVGTVTKVLTGAAVGYVGTVAMSRWHTSVPPEEAPAVQQEREDRQKKFEFEVQEQSERLNKKEQELKSLEEALAKREAALKEERSVLQWLQTKNNAPSDGDVVATQEVQKKVSKVVEPTVVQVVNPDVVVPPNGYVPRRPAVFDGGGNREPFVPKVSMTDEAKLLYFRDPSSVPYRSSDPVIPRRDIIMRNLANVTERSRLMSLSPQHVESFQVSKDGWSSGTPDDRSGERNWNWKMVRFCMEKK